MKFNLENLKTIMKKESKTIAIASGITIGVLIIVILSMYLLMGNKKPTPNEMLNYSIPDLSSGTSTIVNDTVTAYIFKSDTCPHCRDAVSYFKSIVDDYDYLEVKTIRVSRNKDDSEEQIEMVKANNELMQKVATELEKGPITGVPLIVIGSEFTLNGYSAARNETLKDAIKEAYESENYEDIVEKVIDENKDLKISIEDLKTN